VGVAARLTAEVHGSTVGELFSVQRQSISVSSCYMKKK